MSEPHPHHPFIATVEEPRNVRAKAEDQACQKAIAGLGEMGYNYKNELNNKIVNGSRNQRTLDFHRTQSGPNDQRKHTSTVMIDGETLPDYTATSTREIYADELACKMYLEANYPEYRY
ncbi:hypothetical protein C0995_004674 [Termitomyces sp. Mi166|nr:hypothetical protein C0995_004674 [Termitomyces sp. Mi166\